VAAEKARDEQPDPLTLLGVVSPPAPETLDRAREALWSAVAAEMLGAAPDNAARERQDARGRPDARWRPDARDAARRERGSGAAT
jgi:hypothetical protein